MRTAADLHASLVANMHAAEATAMRANDDAIRHAVQAMTATGKLDNESADLLRSAQRLVIGLTAALAAVLDVHRGLRDRYGILGCRECDTLEAEPCRTVRQLAQISTLYKLQRLPIVDAAEAFRRGLLHRTEQGEAGQPITLLEEIPGGFVVRHLHLELPPPPTIPKPTGERVLIVDRATGAVSIWPLLPTPTLAEQYDQYRRTGQPVDLPVDPNA